ncbi:hypothetical protein PGTUg99_035944 [Puccinia graminis f. sp. tritici]|uniref:Uncharacterized protein n=1 Tax=Puccinia graminis f. sp. tritici TaxID=56615 RepID=A0A5B0Q9I9_PUCGR|nr:hypothetical protein PGTUg99_035944 [Puccinia graminis f. sp. tritici]
MQPTQYIIGGPGPQQPQYQAQAQGRQTSDIRCVYPGNRPSNNQQQPPPFLSNISRGIHNTSTHPTHQHLIPSNPTLRTSSDGMGSAASHVQYHTDEVQRSGHAHKSVGNSSHAHESVGARESVSHGIQDAGHARDSVGHGIQDSGHARESVGHASHSSHACQSLNSSHSSHARESLNSSHACESVGHGIQDSGHARDSVGHANHSSRARESLSHESREPTPVLPDRIPSPAIPPVSSAPQPSKAADKLKAQLTPDDVMATYEKKTLSQLRDLQRTHVIYKRLNLAIKLEAQDLYFEYQTKQHLLSLKYRRPFSALTKYLGQRRTRQKQSSWHKFQKNDKSAQEALRNTEHNIGQRNKAVSALYKQADPSNRNSGVEGRMLESSSDPNADERDRFGHIFKSTQKVRQEVKAWAEGVQLKLKELSDQFGIEGFLVLAGQEHRNPFFFQGGSVYGDQYLQGLIDKDGDPIRKFAVWTAGAKKTIKKKTPKAPNPAVSSLPNNTVNGQPPKKKSRAELAAENRDVCQGSLALNHQHIGQEFKKMYLEVQADSVKKDTRGWPGTNTALRLAVYNRKLVVHDNPVGLLAEHILNVPIKKMDIETTWPVLRGLKNKWIELVELQPDEAPKTPLVRKRKASAIESTPATKKRIADETEDEDEEEETEDEEEEEDETEDEDELIDDFQKFFDEDDDNDDDDYEMQ